MRRRFRQSWKLFQFFFLALWAVWTGLVKVTHSRRGKQVTLTYLNYLFPQDQQRVLDGHSIELEQALSRFFFYHHDISARRDFLRMFARFCQEQNVPLEAVEIAWLKNGSIRSGESL